MKKTTKIIILFAAVVLISGLTLVVYHYDAIFKSKWEIVDDLDGNIFPSIVVSLARTNNLVIPPMNGDGEMLGNKKSTFAIKIENSVENSKVRLELVETPFYHATTTEFELKDKKKIYYLYPNMIWKYEALMANEQPQPVDVSFRMKLDGEDIGSVTRTFSVRSIYECLLGYRDATKKYHDTGIFFAAYVNEDYPLIDKILREALDAKIVKLFQGYQAKNHDNVKKQVYAIWYALQKRNFKYSSISKTSLSSTMLFSQRVRTVDYSLESSQINCIDGSVLFASFLRAINLDPILVRIPGHVFVGFYLDKEHTQKMFLETTLIGQIDLEDYLSQEQVEEALIYENDTVVTATVEQVVDSKMIEDDGKTRQDSDKPVTQVEASLNAFNLAIEYATKKYETHERYFGTSAPNYMYLEINDSIRKIIQPIGK